MRICLLFIEILLFQIPFLTIGQTAGNCGSYAKITTPNYGFRAGNIDVSGDQLTVEANINSLGFYPNSTTSFRNTTHAQDIVSKHQGFSDVNYLLRINHAEITTSNGFCKTDDVCDLPVNQTFHLAMVYNGKSLRFYRNGQLLSEKSCSGNMILNDWLTTIGAYASQTFNPTSSSPEDETFNGYINEVRIWNVARTEEELNQYKDQSLPNPTTQTGLLAYYKFDDLKNKQGNSNYDLQLLGSPVINQVNPSCMLSSFQCPSTLCQSYAKMSTLNSGFRAGDIDISGDKITVEALINSAGLFPGADYTWEQNVVSKHSDPSDVNYLLRMNHAEITTTNGFYETEKKCDPTINQTFHIAMVYDGTSLKFYRNGQLLSETPCSGNLILNDWQTTIGSYALQKFSATTKAENETFYGYINEVRIWNVARTQNELDQYKDQALPKPTTQAGLVAYYQFNDLKNKQGNANYDLQLLGSPQINQANPFCDLGTEPCPICMLTASFDVQPDICNPAHFSFASTTQNVTKYSWQFGDNTIPNATTKNADAIYKTAGTYNVSLQVSDDKGCSATALKSVTASLLPKAIKTDAATICKGQTVQLVSNTDETGAQYEWSPQLHLSDPSIADPVATMDVSTLFKLTVTRANGCVDKDSVQITVPATAVFTLSPVDTSVCVGSDIALTATGGDTYLWKNSKGDIVGSVPTINPNMLVSEKYILEVSSMQCGEKATLSSTVHVFPVNEYAITISNNIDCAHTSAQLSVPDASNVQWHPQDGLVVAGQLAIISPTHTTTYQAKIADQYGCQYDASYTQVVAFDPAGVHFFVPNAFTPNGDGKNDIFRVRTDVDLSLYSLRIYNRYGQLVFQTQNQQMGWDGTYKKESQPAGTYVYEIVANSHFCGEFSKKGTIVLIR